MSTFSCVAFPKQCDLQGSLKLLRLVLCPWLLHRKLLTSHIRASLGQAARRWLETTAWLWRCFPNGQGRSASKLVHIDLRLRKTGSRPVSFVCPWLPGKPRSLLLGFFRRGVPKPTRSQRNRPAIPFVILSCETWNCLISPSDSTSGASSARTRDTDLK